MTKKYLKILLSLTLFLSVCLASVAKAAAGGPQEINNIEVVKEGPYWVSQWIEFSIAEDLVSFQILGFASAEVWNQVTDLIAPNGKKYTQSSNGKTLNMYSQPILSNARSLNRSTAVVQGMSSFLFPNNPALGAPPAGVWKTRFFFHSEPKQKKMSAIIIEKSLKDLNGTVIPARIWISPNSYWTNSKTQLKDVVMGATKYLGEAGLTLQILSTSVLSESPNRPMHLPEDMSSIALKVNAPDAVNIYLMPDMENQGDAINGFACIGGPINLQWSHPCFVSVYATSKAHLIPLKEQAKVLAHEIAHYLGLFHTREDGYMMIGTLLDVFDDTEDSNSGKNIMDTGLHDEIPHFSEMQKSMLRLSPALRQ